MLAAVSGGRSPHSASIRLDAGTTRPECRSKTARTARARGARRTGRPSTSASTGPSTRYSVVIRATVTPVSAGPAPQEGLLQGALAGPGPSVHLYPAGGAAKLLVVVDLLREPDPRMPPSEIHEACQVTPRWYETGAPVRLTLPAPPGGTQAPLYGLKRRKGRIGSRRSCRSFPGPDQR